MIRVILIAYLLVGFGQLQAQFAPPAGQEGSTAIYKDSSIFQAWATSAVVDRGFRDISQEELGYTTIGDETSPLGIAGEGSVVSLGDGGIVTLEFDVFVRNGEGADFAIFENGFRDDFLEFAFVEVSSDGQNFVRFPAISNIDTNQQVGGFDTIDCRLVYNLAGKYRANYGTPFDLEEVKDNPLLDVNKITHIRVIDVVGSLQAPFASKDSRGIKINDPWATPFESGGFDLDAVGLIHTQSKGTVEAAIAYPNPIQNTENLTVLLPNIIEGDSYQYAFYDIDGRFLADGDQLVQNSSLSIPIPSDIHNKLIVLKIYDINTLKYHYFKVIIL